MAGIGELCERIFFIRGCVFSFVLKHSATVGKKLGRDTVIYQDLMSDLIIGIKRFLCIKISTKYLSSGIINGQMEMNDGGTKPKMRRSIHLDKFAKISASRTSRMCIEAIKKIKLVF